MGYFGLFNLSVVKNKYFMRLMINSETDKLFKNACGYAILTYIGFKANLKKEVDANGCHQGECLLPGLDFYKNVTEKEYNKGLKYILDNDWITIKEENGKKIAKYTSNNLIDITEDFEN